MTIYSERRLFEFVPGVLSWGTLVLMVFFSWKLPTAVAIFIILFDIYWLMKTVYLFFHLRSAFKIMRENTKVDWLSKLDELERDPKNPNTIRTLRIVEEKLSYELTGIFFHIQKELGRFARERQYGDALARELTERGIKFKREQAIEVAGRKSSLMDFVIENRVAIELKAKPFIQKEDYYQTQRYLQSSGLELGLIVNFAQPLLKPKRVLNTALYSEHSDVFVASDSISWKDIRHLVIFPMYREPYEVVRDSFEHIATAHYPKEKLLVVLATEERAGEEAQRIARRIVAEFGPRLHRLLVTTHPAGLKGEIPGKGSNEAWAAKEAVRELIDARGIDPRQVIVSAFDIDTQVPAEYFSRLTYVFLTAPNRLRAIYQPIPFYFNNIYQASALSRIRAFSSSFWEMMQQARPERLTSFSSQSIPLPALIDFGYWERDVVSEDSRVFWQGYLCYKGDFRVEPLLMPVSLDANAAPTFWETTKNIYKQQRRWAWGAENVPYLLARFSRKSEIPLRKRCYWLFHMIRGFHSWATDSFIIFALGWLPILLGGKDFNGTLLSYSLPQVTGFIMNLAMIGVASSAVASVLLLPPKPAWFRRRHYLLYLLEWVLVPVTFIVFGSLPALDAQTRLMLGGRARLGFWVTPKARSEVVRK
jgi:GxxExxY protein